MEVINLNNHIQVLYAKEKIENQLISENKISKEMEIPEFVTFLNLQNSIFIKEDLVVPFKILNDMLFTVASDNIINELNTILSEISYNLDNLKTIYTNDVYLGELDKYPFYFIINSEYKVIPKK